MATIGAEILWKICSRAVNVGHLVSSDMREFASTLAATGGNFGQAKVGDLCLKVRSEQNVCTKTHTRHNIIIIFMFVCSQIIPLHDALEHVAQYRASFCIMHFTNRRSSSSSSSSIMQKKLWSTKTRQKALTNLVLKPIHS